MQDNPNHELASLHTLREFEALARARLPHACFEYIAAGAGDEISLRRNEEAFDDILLWPRAFRDVEKVSTATRLFGAELPVPILLAPAAYQKLFCAEGELAAARAAAEFRIPLVLSSNTSVHYSEVYAASNSAPWFQLYLHRQRSATERVVHEIEALGCPAICLTIDTPILGTRTRQFRARFALPPGFPLPHQQNHSIAGDEEARPYGITTLEAIGWLRSIIRSKFLVKGLVHPDDIGFALDAGVDGVMVSNHGGRNLDTTPSAIELLPLITDRVAGRVPVIFDGGVRRGTDVAKAIGRGAAAVMIGRPYLYAMAVGGAAGVSRCLQILVREFAATMALLGRTSLHELDRSIEFVPDKSLRRRTSE